MDLDLDGRVAVVTGATAGIGRASAHALAGEGAHLVLVARRESMLEEVAEEIAATGAVAPTFVAADLTGMGSARAIRDHVGSVYGRLDIVVNNAGTSAPQGDLSDEEAWSQMIDLNFHAKRRLTDQLLPLLREGGRGRVVNLIGGLEPLGVHPAQAAVAACAMWSKGLAREVAGSGTTVNCVCPGRVSTEQMLRYFPDRAAEQRYAAKHIPAGRFGTPEEVASTIVFLASAVSSYLTGNVLNVDGGMRWSPF